MTTSPRSLLTLTAALLAALATACGTELPNAADDSDTDDLSATTYSMEMLRANPALLPSVSVPDGVHVNGRGRPMPAAELRDMTPEEFKWSSNNPAASWLFDANGIAGFKNLADPVMDADGKKVGAYARKPGDLYSDAGKLVWTNIDQGYLGDCYFASSVAAVFLADKGGTLTKNMIVPNVVNGKTVSYFATFYQASSRKVKVEVDIDLPHSNKSGNVLYMQSDDNTPGYEKWAPSLIEKAYAKWNTSYAHIGNGGTASDALFALTGKKTKSYSPKGTAVVAAIEAAGKESRAQVACTYGDHDGVKYDGTGVYSDHCYTLRGIVRKNGKVFVQLRNPWGPTEAGASEPTEPPDDGVQDGLFDLELSKFATLYHDVSIVP
ncbi:MAG: hypothetical protein JST92_09825 [Deltaproteobacteria bacterium]|nr:hypothetical protein [Deltaproteobacteria bacterium]